MNAAGPICQTALPFLPWMDPMLARLPGLMAIAPAGWIVRDEAFAAQMAERDRLIAQAPEAVLATLPEGEALAAELLETLLEDLSGRDGYTLSGTRITRPDGVTVDTRAAHPLAVAGRLVQEDFALLRSTPQGHSLVGGVICFPAHWRLSDKIGRSLAGVHAPADAIDAAMDARLERLLAGLRPERAVMRANVLIYTDPALHQPHPEGVRKVVQAGAARFVRMERQVLRRLPRTAGIAFAIHTYLVAAAAIPKDAVAGLLAHRPEFALSASRP